jgi:predicted transcriptional regulator
MTIPTIVEKLTEAPLFDAKAFGLEVRIAMARENLSLRKLQAITGVDQASIHRAAVKELSPSIETYLRLRRWIDSSAVRAHLSALEE